MNSEYRQRALIAGFMRVIVSVLIVCASSAWTMTQTVDDVQRNFSPSGLPSRFVGNGVELMVWFDSDKQVCRALWPASAFQNGVISVGDKKMSSAEIKRVLDLLAPTGVRGRPIDNWGGGMLNGNVGDQNYPYENLTLKLYFSFSFDPEAFDLAMQSARPTIPMYIPEEDESNETVVNSRMVEEEIISAAVADVKWKNRKCAE